MDFLKLLDRRNVLLGVGAFFGFEILQRSFMRFVSEQKRSPENRKGIKEFKTIDVNGVRVDVLGIAHTLTNLESNYYDFLSLLRTADELIFEGGGVEDWSIMSEDEKKKIRSLVTRLSGLRIDDKLAVIGEFKKTGGFFNDEHFFDYISAISLADNPTKPVFIYESNFTQLQILYVPAMLIYGMHFFRKLDQKQKVKFWEMPVIATLVSNLKTSLGGVITVLFGPDKQLTNEQVFNLAFDLFDYRDALLASVIHENCGPGKRIESGKRLKIMRGVIHGHSLHNYLVNPVLARAALLKYPQFSAFEDPQKAILINVNNYLL